MTDACSFWLSSKNLTKTYCTVTVHIRDLGHIVKRRIYILLIYLFILGCSAPKKDLIGTYASENPSLVKKAWKTLAEGYDGFITGSELELNQDSTFQETTCGNVLTEQWYHKNDTIFLKYETNKWRNDSLQQNGFRGRWPKVPEGVKKVKYNGNKIFFQWESSEGEKIYAVLKKK